MKSKLLGVLCFAVLCVTLALGLSPFHTPRNDVAWLKGANGLAFGRYGSILSSGALQVADSQEEASGSIEILVQPDRWSTSATFLALYRPEKQLVFRLRQSLEDLELQAEVQSDALTPETHFYVGDAFYQALRRKQPVFVTITSGWRGTAVYLDGVPAKTGSHFWIPTGALTGRLIVGDSPRQPDSFRGRIEGLAIYDAELDGAQVLRHYQTWKRNGRPDVAPNERNIALYLFDEHAGNTIGNHAREDPALYIPERYTVVDKIILEPFWKEFNFSRSYWGGNVKNIIGFIPLGFCFYAYFVIAHPVKRAALVTVGVGTVVSVSIEILQAFLPMRDSGTTDIITNTLGTFVGVACYKVAYSVCVKRFPWLGRLAAQSS